MIDTTRVRNQVKRESDFSVSRPKILISVRNIRSSVLHCVIFTSVIHLCYTRNQLGEESCSKPLSSLPLHSFSLNLRLRFQLLEPSLYSYIIGLDFNSAAPSLYFHTLGSKTTLKMHFSSHLAAVLVLSFGVHSAPIEVSLSKYPIEISHH